MELYQIGKDLASIDARLKKLEDDDCDCKSSSKLTNRKLPKEQLSILEKLRKEHENIFKDLNAVMKKYKISDKLVIAEFKLVDVGMINEDDDEECCMCCSDGSGGYEYCCNFSGCGCCD